MLFFGLSFRLDIFRWALDMETRQGSTGGVANETEMGERGEVTEEDEKLLWKKDLLGYQTATSLVSIIYFSNESCLDH